MGPLGRGEVEALDDCFRGREQPLSVTPGPRLPVPNATVGEKAVRLCQGTSSAVLVIKAESAAF